MDAPWAGLADWYLCEDCGEPFFTADPERRWCDACLYDYAEREAMAESEDDDARPPAD
jgi:hypothetical protein